MSDMKKFLDYEGVKHLWSKINMQDYPNNEILINVINAIDETKADRSELVQSDWNENDETASDFIKNKPFYEAEVLSIIYEGQVDLIMKFYSFLVGTLEKEILCEKGKTYNVTLNGENDESIYQGEVVCEQDGSLNFDIPDSLFYAEISGDLFNIYSNDDYFDDSVFGAGIYNLKIEGNGITTLKTLDEKFIPDTIARIEDIPEINYPVTSVNGMTGDVVIEIPEQVQPDWAQTDETAVDFIKNKPEALVECPSEEIVADILQNVYPVGAIYLSMNSTSPASLFGGTWEQIQDRFLLGASSTRGVGTTGGASSHTLTVKQLPKVEGTIVTHGKYNGTPIAGVKGAFTATSTVSGKYMGGSVSGADSIERIAFSNGGEGAAHNNMPPYLAVYMWKRIA